MMIIMIIAIIIILLLIIIMCPTAQGMPSWLALHREGKLPDRYESLPPWGKGSLLDAVRTFTLTVCAQQVTRV